jgi:hypothetical protein
MDTAKNEKASPNTSTQTDSLRHGSTCDWTRKAILMLAVLMARALTLQLLWGWFVHPLLCVPRLTYAYAIGLTLLVQVFIPGWRPRNSDTDARDGADNAAGNASHELLRRLAETGLIALLGAVVHLLGT